MFSANYWKAITLCIARGTHWAKAQSNQIKIVLINVALIPSSTLWRTLPISFISCMLPVIISFSLWLHNRFWINVISDPLQVGLLTCVCLLLIQDRKLREVSAMLSWFEYKTFCSDRSWHPILWLEINGALLLWNGKAILTNQVFSVCNSIKTVQWIIHQQWTRCLTWS